MKKQLSNTQDLNKLILKGEYDISNSLNVPLEVISGTVKVTVSKSNIKQVISNKDFTRGDYSRKSTDGGRSWSDWYNTNTGTQNVGKLKVITEDVLTVKKDISSLKKYNEQNSLKIKEFEVFEESTKSNLDKLSDDIDSNSEELLTTKSNLDKLSDNIDSNKIQNKENVKIITEDTLSIKEDISSLKKYNVENSLKIKEFEVSTKNDLSDFTISIAKTQKKIVDITDVLKSISDKDFTQDETFISFQKNINIIQKQVQSLKEQFSLSPNNDMIQELHSELQKLKNLQNTSILSKSENNNKLQNTINEVNVLKDEVSDLKLDIAKFQNRNALDKIESNKSIASLKESIVGVSSKIDLLNENTAVKIKNEKDEILYILGLAFKALDTSKSKDLTNEAKIMLNKVIYKDFV